MTGKTLFQHDIFPSKKKTVVALNNDFLCNKTINSVGRGILLVIQFLNQWSAVWAEESGITVVNAVTILLYGFLGLRLTTSPYNNKNLNIVF